MLCIFVLFFFIKQASYALEKTKPLQLSLKRFELAAVTTRLELATSGVTGRHSNQLNYATVCAMQN